MLRPLDLKDTLTLKGAAILAIVFHNYYHVISAAQENEFNFRPARFGAFLSAVQARIRAFRQFLLISGILAWRSSFFYRLMVWPGATGTHRRVPPRRPDIAHYLRIAQYSDNYMWGGRPRPRRTPGPTAEPGGSARVGGPALGPAPHYLVVTGNCHRISRTSINAALDAPPPSSCTSNDVPSSWAA